METKTTFYMTIIYPSKNKNIQCLCFRAEKCVGNFEVFCIVEIQYTLRLLWTKVGKNILSSVHTYTHC